jgi:CheY-like chemotaxis protein
MKKKLNCILLVDDNTADNYYHQIVIKGMNITERIEVATDGVEALNFLEKENQVPPELIFLDINMPRMNGWEFLEKYKHLDVKQKSKIIIVMLTTSAHPKDLEKAKQMEEVSGYKVKPLTEEMLKEILEKYFAEDK